MVDRAALSIQPEGWLMLTPMPASGWPFFRRASSGTETHGLVAFRAHDRPCFPRLDLVTFAVIEHGAEYE